MLIPDIDLSELSEGLQTLESDYKELADADMDAMFQQVGDYG
jgi:hypothetical protein